jgi:cell division initiation protein
MDNPKSSSQQSSLDSLRTVEFRQTLRGYHIDDVDEYLERVAIEAEALQEQSRQSVERMRQAAERIAQLEQTVQQLEQQIDQMPATAPAAPAAVTDDSLQRTLLLAQKFVEQTEAEAETQARATLAEAETRARNMLGEAEARARALTEETERHLREDIARLESVRTQLAGDVETMAHHLDNERNRLRSALGDMLAWVDEHVQPAASLLAQPTPPTTARPDTPPTPPSPFATGDDDNKALDAGGSFPAPTMTGGQPGGRPAEAERIDDDTRPSPADRQGMMPLGEPQGARAGVPH